MISIILPYYNSERFLKDSIKSILSQSLRNWELLLIDDGSNDNSKIIADSYGNSDSRIKSLHFQHGGLSIARNRGLDLCKGEYIIFMDSDDILLPDALSLLYQVIKSENADVTEGRIIRNLKKNITVRKTFGKYHYDSERAIENVLYQKILSSSVCGKLFKKELFNNLRFKEGILYEDLEIITRILDKIDSLIYIDIPVYYYRKNSKSIINTWNNERLIVLKITADIEKKYLSSFNLSKAAKDRRLSANFNMMALCDKNGLQSHCDLCWKYIKANRKSVLFNNNSRFKNKLGILTSYFGRNFITYLFKIVYQ